MKHNLKINVDKSNKIKIRRYNYSLYYFVTHNNIEGKELFNVERYKVKYIIHFYFRIGTNRRISMVCNKLERYCLDFKN